MSVDFGSEKMPVANSHGGRWPFILDSIAFLSTRQREVNHSGVLTAPLLQASQRWYALPKKLELMSVLLSTMGMVR